MIIKRHILLRKILNLTNRYQIIQIAIDLISDTHDLLKTTSYKGTLAGVYNVTEKILEQIYEDQKLQILQVDMNNIISIYEIYLLKYVDQNFLREDKEVS